MVEFSLWRASVIRRRGIGVFALGAVLAVLLAGCGRQGQEGSRQATPPRMQVDVVTLHPQSVMITTELPGRTTASLTAEVRPQVSGIIKARLFKQGSEVKAGDPLYQIDRASYQAAYDSAVAAEQKAEAAVPSAEAKVERYKGLIKQNAVSKQDLDDAIAALAQAKADVASAKASVDTARINLNYTKIAAPIGGRIDKSSLTPGALVTASQTTALTTIRKIDPINVDVTESATNLLNWREAIRERRLKFAGPDVHVKLKLDNGTIYSHYGKLAFVESNVSESTGTFGLRATFPNPDRLLLPGMYVRAIIEEGVAPNSFLVPQRAVTHNTKGQPTAMFVSKDNKVEQRVLSVERNVGNYWLVTSGVHDGDRIIVDGTQMVRPGQPVTAVEVSIDENTGDVIGPAQGSTRQGAPPPSNGAKTQQGGQPNAAAGK
jgi:membrane fusion protein (multidrug efflux system)